MSRNSYWSRNPAAARCLLASSLLAALLFGAALWFSSAVAAQEAAPAIQFSGMRWQTNGDVKVEEFAGREALRVRGGGAALLGTALGEDGLQNGPVFQNGIIEVDVRTTGHRSFFGVGFRMEGPHREDFYLRPHQSGRFDALQYQPIYNSVAAWQLYPEHNAQIELPPDRWMHVKLVVAGPRLEVFVDGADRPVMVVERLERGDTRGGILLWGGFPGGQPGELYPNAFSNFRFQTDERQVPIPPAPRPAADSGLIDAWAVSAVYPEPEDLAILPTLSAHGPWKVWSVDDEGRLNLAMTAALPGGRERGTVLARVILRSDAARTVRLGYGFSDQGTVFLNGAPVLQSDNSYRARSERYLGVMRVDRDTLYLPLRAGDNELVFAVTEAFGGWGVTGRLLDREGVQVTAPLPD